VTHRIPLSPRPTLVIDTNILLLLVGYQCSLIESAVPLERSRLLSDIRRRPDAVSPERFTDLWQLFKVAAQRIVTQHVIAEAYNLGKNLSCFRGKKELVWRSALKILENPGIDEASIAISELNSSAYREILLQIGPADAGLLYIAEQRKAVVLTEDGPLQHWASTRSISCLTLNQIGNA
jgi:hypothetical protein